MDEHMIKTKDKENGESIMVIRRIIKIGQKN